jgi:ABC-type uncharacterized transport system involved in gliding motility auxiliary subunit
MKPGWLKTRQTKYTAYVTVYILVILGVLAAVNVLANRYNKSFDSTKNKRYSLSDQTQKIVGNLTQNVTISYFDRATEFEAARDLLGRYGRLSPRLRVEYIDTVKNPAKARAMNVRSDGTVYVQVGEKRELARGLTEEEITGALIRALKTGDRSACFVAGSGERSIDDTSTREGIGFIKILLEKYNYRTRTISLLEKPAVPKDCTLLVVAGPERDYPDAEAAAIQSYVESGGRALLLIQPALKRGREEPTDNPALLKVLAGWGVTPGRGVVLSNLVAFGYGPLAPLVINYESHPVVRAMPKNAGTIFPLARPLETRSAGRTTVEKLFSTLEESFATTNLGAGLPEYNAKTDQKGPLTLGAAGTYNTGKAESQGRFVVVGSVDWAANGALADRRFFNRDLLMNMMDWLASDENLISIRPKEPEDQSFALTAGQQKLVWYWSIVLLPVAVILSGFLVWWKRR